MYLMTIRGILRLFGIFCVHLEYFVASYIFFCFGMLYQEKSSKSAPLTCQKNFFILVVDGQAGLAEDHAAEAGSGQPRVQVVQDHA
jgi:hypothetical protein